MVSSRNTHCEKCIFVLIIYNTHQIVLEYGVFMNKKYALAIATSFLAAESVFAAPTEKRANNILRSSGEEKEEMLAMLGLDKDATFEDVYSALEAV